ncbi:MAG TPA: SOS response-associated peptidase, partial [Planctomycetaceae bacterium]|nr:SOS response-associated peptidase [Planctomycetaceae bacterium]
ARDLVEIFELLRETELSPRYNIAPTQNVAVIRQDGKSRQLALMRWGLVPSWSKDPKGGPPIINARAETIATKPSFRTAFMRRRCLIPADGFYEWQKKAASTTKIPHYIRMAKDRPFAFAGLWETWRGNGDAGLESCTIVTTEANDLMRPLHDRMPVILPEEHFAQWPDPKNENVSELEALLWPYSPDEMTAFPVSTLVNSPRNDRPECIAKPSV